MQHVDKIYYSVEGIGEYPNQIRRTYFALDYGNTRIGHQIVDVPLQPADARPVSYFVGPETTPLLENEASERGTIDPLPTGRGHATRWAQYRSIKELLERLLRERQNAHTTEVVALAQALAAIQST